MQYLKEQTLEQINTRAISSFIALSGMAVMLPFFIHLQWISGPIVNAILILTLFLCGIRSALVIALVPSLMALAGGLLPAILAPAVPFIMISNTILILTIDWAYNNLKVAKKGYWIGLALGALLKFAFLFFSVNIISNLLIKKELAVKIAQMMSWPQLATALAGGMIAWAVLKWLKRI